MNVHQGVHQADPLTPEIEPFFTLHHRAGSHFGRLQTLIDLGDPVFQNLRHARGAAIDHSPIRIVRLERLFQRSRLRLCLGDSGLGHPTVVASMRHDQRTYQDHRTDRGRQRQTSEARPQQTASPEIGSAPSINDGPQIMRGPERRERLESRHPLVQPVELT